MPVKLLLSGQTLRLPRKSCCRTSWQAVSVGRDRHFAGVRISLRLQSQMQDSPDAGVPRSALYDPFSQQLQQDATAMKVPRVRSHRRVKRSGQISDSDGTAGVSGHGQNGEKQPKTMESAIIYVQWRHFVLPAAVPKRFAGKKDEEGAGQ